LIPGVLPFIGPEKPPLGPMPVRNFGPTNADTPGIKGPMMRLRGVSGGEEVLDDGG
jgi:hypothetical protein